MKEAVPQKGFKMKLSINQGPYAEGAHCGSIFVEHCKMISNFLFDWYSSLPKEVAVCVEVMVVTSVKDTSMQSDIELKVVLSGLGGWKTQFTKQLTSGYYRKDRTSTFGEVFGVAKFLKEDLNRRLKATIEAEMSVREKLVSSLDSLVLLMKKPEA